MLVLLIVAGWAGGTYLVDRYRQTRVSPWRDPRAVLKWSDIDPILALRGLGDASSQTVFRAALERGEIETAYATLVYAIDLKPDQRCGSLLLLASHKAQGSRRAIQRSCYKMAGSVATVALDMSDLTRATVLLEAGRGLGQLGASADALFYLDQAYAVARYSDRMTQAHRRTLLDELIPLYRALGRKPETWRALIDQALTPTLSIEEGKSIAVQLERPQLLYLSDAVIRATASRQRMLHQVLLMAAQGKDSISEYQLDDLASVLRYEDQVRQQSYAMTAPSGQGMELARDRVAWMVLKSRIAHKGFGLRIVSEWEEQVDEIDAELSVAQDALYAQYAAVKGAEAERSVLSLQLEHGLLSFYPGWPQAEWAARLERLEPQRTLRVTARAEKQNIYFFLVGEPKP
jgi:hypothetical protein